MRGYEGRGGYARLVSVMLWRLKHVANSTQFANGDKGVGELPVWTVRCVGHLLRSVPPQSWSYPLFVFQLHSQPYTHNAHPAAQECHILACSRPTVEAILVDISRGLDPVHPVPVECPDTVPPPDFGYITGVVDFPLRPRQAPPVQSQHAVDTTLCNCRRWGTCVCSKPPFLIDESGELVECSDACGCQCSATTCRLRQVQCGTRPKVAVKFIDQVLAGSG